MCGCGFATARIDCLHHACARSLYMRARFVSPSKRRRCSIQNRLQKSQTEWWKTTIAYESDCLSRLSRLLQFMIISYTVNKLCSSLLWAICLLQDLYNLLYKAAAHFIHLLVYMMTELQLNIAIKSLFYSWISLACCSYSYLFSIGWNVDCLDNQPKHSHARLRTMRIRFTRRFEAWSLNWYSNIHDSELCQFPPWGSLLLIAVWCFDNHNLVVLCMDTYIAVQISSCSIIYCKHACVHFS